MIRIAPLLLLPLLIVACGESERSTLAKKRDCAIEGRRFFERYAARNSEWRFAEPEFAYDRKRDSCVCSIEAFESPPGKPLKIDSKREELWDVLSNSLIASRITLENGTQIPDGMGSVEFTNKKAALFPVPR